MSHLFYYDGFLINKNKYLASTLLEQLELGEKSSTFEKINKIDKDYTLEDFHFSLKTQIRFLCLNTIETLFELIFALYPNFDPTSYNDKIVIERIVVSSNQKLISFIQSFQDSENVSNLLDRIIENQYSVAHHLFYFNLENTLNYPNELDKDKSIKNIKYALNVLANEISDRDEYNAFKHADRIFPYIKSIIIKPELSDESFTLTSENSLTYFTKPKDESSGYGIKVKQVDHYSDYGKILLTSKLLENIISPRKYYFGSRSKFPDVHRFDEDMVSMLLTWKGKPKNES